MFTEDVIRVLPHGVCLLEGPDHTLTYANPAFTQLILGQPTSTSEDHDHFLQILGERGREVLTRVFYEGTSETLTQVRVCDADNQERMANLTIHPQRQADGKIFGLILSVQEVVQTVRSKHTVDADALLQLVAERARLYMVYMDTNKTIRFANSLYAAWFDLPPSEIIGKTGQQLARYPEIYSRVSEFEDRALKGESVSFELKVPNKKGESIPFVCECIPHIDETGRVLGMLKVVSDVSEKERSILAIEASDRRYRSLTDTIPQLMWTADTNGQVDFVNQRCLDFTRLDLDSKLGTSWIDAIHPDDKPRVGQAWMSSIQLGEPFKEEYRLRDGLGEYHWFQGHAVPIRDAHNKIQYWIGTATDIEASRQHAAELNRAKELAEAANRAKSSLLANMSHEIRTPLGIILGFSDLLRDETLNSSQRQKFIENIDRNGKLLSRIIDDILDLAKVEAGRINLEKTDFSIRTLVNEVHEQFSPTTKQKGITLRIEFDENLPDTVYSDPARVRQVLNNVIGNSVKFTDVGEIQILVRAKVELSDKLMLVIQVQDTGCGIPQSLHRELFAPFTQADNSSTRRFGGTGLGLSLSRRLCEFLGGDIAAHSAGEGLGSTFTIRFRGDPANRAPTPSPAVSAEPSKSGKNARPLQDFRLLVVDDSEDNQQLLHILLTSRGAQVDVACGGTEALRLIRARAYDLVLMDIQMPGMDGYQTLQALREQGCQTSVVALTAHAMVEDRKKTKEAGFAYHLTKPIDSSELYRVVAEHKVTTDVAP